MGATGKETVLPWDDTKITGGEQQPVPAPADLWAQAQEEEETEDTSLEKTPSDDENDLEGVATLTLKGQQKWFSNPKLSNHDAWYSDLTIDQQDAIDYYVSSNYQYLNDELYTIPWDEMSPAQKEKAADLYEAINGFELNKAVKLLRICNFQIFGLPKGTKLSEQGLKDLLSEQQDYQTNGFLSFTTKTEHGTYSHSKGIMIDLVMPPNKGGGAWLGTHFNEGESEFLLNSNAVLRFDPDSVYTDALGRLHVSATWLGQAKDQVFKSKKK